MTIQSVLADIKKDAAALPDLSALHSCPPSLNQAVQKTRSGAQDLYSSGSKTTSDAYNTLSTLYAELSDLSKKKDPEVDSSTLSDFDALLSEIAASVSVLQAQANGYQKKLKGTSSEVDQAKTEASNTLSQALKQKSELQAHLEHLKSEAGFAQTIANIFTFGSASNKGFNLVKAQLTAKEAEVATSQEAETNYSAAMAACALVQDGINRLCADLDTMPTAISEIQEAVLDSESQANAIGKISMALALPGMITSTKDLMAKLGSASSTS